MTLKEAWDKYGEGADLYYFSDGNKVIITLPEDIDKAFVTVLFEEGNGEGEESEISFADIISDQWDRG